jgi:hypothetical protein
MNAPMHVETHQHTGRLVAGGTGSSSTGTVWTRLAALSGVVFAVALALSVIGGGSPPSTSASAAKVAHYYLVHKNTVNRDAIFTAAAVLFGLGFLMYLRAHIRRIAGDAVSGLYTAGVLVFAISGGIGAGFNLSLGDSPKSLSPATLQGLNVLNQDVTWPVVSIGLALSFLAVGLVVVRTRVAPVWLGWLAFLFAVVAGSLFLSFIPLLASPLVVLVVAIIMAIRNPAMTPAPDDIR